MLNGNSEDMNNEDDSKDNKFDVILMMKISHYLLKIILPTLQSTLIIYSWYNQYTSIQTKITLFCWYVKVKIDAK